MKSLIGQFKGLDLTLCVESQNELLSCKIGINQLVHLQKSNRKSTRRKHKVNTNSSL